MHRNATTAGAALTTTRSQISGGPKSFASLRHRPSQAKVRSTTHRRGRNLEATLTVALQDAGEPFQPGGMSGDACLHRLSNIPGTGDRVDCQAWSDPPRASSRMALTRLFIIFTISSFAGLAVWQQRGCRLNLRQQSLPLASVTKVKGGFCCFKLHLSCGGSAAGESCIRNGICQSINDH